MYQEGDPNQEGDGKIYSTSQEGGRLFQHRDGDGQGLRCHGHREYCDDANLFKRQVGQDQ